MGLVVDGYGQAVSHLTESRRPGEPSVGLVRAALLLQPPGPEAPDDDPAPMHAGGL